MKHRCAYAPPSPTTATGACAHRVAGTDGPDRIARNVYDAAGRVLQVRRAVGTVLEQAYAAYEYSPNGQRTSVTDANGNRAELRYDGHDRQSRWVFPHPTQTGAVNELDYEGYSYDPAGNRTSLKKRDNRTIVYAYDALNRVSQKTVPASATGASGYSVHYGYDLGGRETSARFGSASGPGVDTLYDGLGRPSATTSDMDGVARTVSYGYDAAGNRSSVSASSGYHLTYLHDFAGATTAVREAGPTTVAALEYDPAGRRDLLRFGPTPGYHTIVDYGYDPAGRLASLSRDLAGSGADQALGFQYNPASQIVQRTGSNDAYVSNTAYEVSRNYAVNGLNQYTAAGPATFLYDDNGNLSHDGSSSFVYDAENRLVSASGARNATLQYDPHGRLSRVTGASGTTWFLYDGDRLIEEYDGAGTRLRAYAHGPGADEPLVWYELTGGTTRRYLHADHQGSIVATADDSSNALAIGAYDAWGIPNDRMGFTADRIGRFGYTGQAWIPELGMWHYKARVYSPTLGRFLQTDPIGYEGGINLYAYVENDPLNHTDPTGESPIDALQEGLEWAGFTPVGAKVDRERIRSRLEIDLKTDVPSAFDPFVTPAPGRRAPSVLREPASAGRRRKAQCRDADDDPGIVARSDTRERMGVRTAERDASRLPAPSAPSAASR